MARYPRRGSRNGDSEGKTVNSKTPIRGDSPEFDPIKNVEALIARKPLTIPTIEQVLHKYKHTRKVVRKQWYAFSMVRRVVSQLAGLRVYSVTSKTSQSDKSDITKFYSYPMDNLAFYLGFVDSISHKSKTDPMTYGLIPCMYKTETFTHRGNHERVKYMVTREGISRYLEFVTGVVREYNDVFGNLKPVTDPMTEDETEYGPEDMEAIQAIIGCRSPTPGQVSSPPVMSA